MFEDIRRCEGAKRHANGFKEKTTAALIETFWSRVNKNGPVVHEQLGPCWLWTGGLKNNGYGYFVIRRKPIYVHRLMYFLTMGITLPDRMACHKCDNPQCCNPQHIFDGTAKDNADDCASKGRRPAGERHCNAKFTHQQVRAIRSSERSHDDLAAEHGVVRHTIANMRARRTYKCVA